jgi:hypothetical protein
MVVPPPADAPPGVSDRRPVLPWAAATVALVTLIVIATFLGRLVSTNTQAAALGKAAPPYPPMQVAAIVRPEAGAALFAVDSGSGRLIALARPDDVTCPPVGLCPTEPAPDALVILDGQSGATLSTTPLTGAARAATNAGTLLVDSVAHLAYAVTPRSVVIFSTQTGGRVGGYDLPRDFGGLSSGGAVLDADHNTLALADNQDALLVNARTGAVKAMQTLPPTAFIDGPILDTARGRLYLELRPTSDGAPTLAVYDTRALQPIGQYTLPKGVRLGPADAAAHALFLFGGDGSTWRLALDALSPSDASQPPQTAPLTRDDGLSNTLALGENPTLAHRYVLTAESERITASGGGAVLAALPLSAPWRSATPIPVDTTRNLIYLPADHGSIVIAQDGDTGVAHLSASAAIILARDILRKFYTADPAGVLVLEPTLFPLQPGHLDQGFWFLSPDGKAWAGPYPGYSSTSVAPGARTGDGYKVQFILNWTDPDTGSNSNTWIWRVAPSGALELLSKS